MLQPASDRLCEGQLKRTTARWQLPHRFGHGVGFSVAGNFRFADLVISPRPDCLIWRDGEGRSQELCHCRYSRKVRAVTEMNHDRKYSTLSGRVMQAKGDVDGCLLPKPAEDIRT